ncbi:MAG: hypothetical protein OXI41_13350 [Chloroflexota bacterium]|nr:hypothetical protein [Chloroflexota bacterium]MDE2894893.1 hypothetical protein [Chloroflexota bacterium]
MVSKISETERASKLRELMCSGETDPALYEDLLPDNAFGDLLRVSLVNQHEDDQRRDYILSVLEQHDIRPDEVHRLCRS